MRLKALLLFALGGISFATEKPNIVVFLVDDMGVMDTSVPFLTDENGEPKRYPLNDWFRTPNMERLAAQGTRLETFYAMSVCSPTRASIMTGKNAARHHTTNWIAPGGNNRGPFGPKKWNWKGLGKGDVTLPRLLGKEGYRTIHVGKGHFGPLGSEGAEPRSLGFDVNIGGGAWGHPKSYSGLENYGNKGPVEKRSHNVPGLEKYHGTDTHLSEALTLEANAAVSQAVEDEKPFFLYFAHYAVHAPFQSDSRFAANYEKSGKTKAEKAFATLIEGMDKSLGDLLDNLEKLGVAENTLVIFLGDNGSDNPAGEGEVVACAAPLRGKKGSCYEGGMRVPFIAAWAKPGKGDEVLKIARGHLASQTGRVMDLFPTILDVAGVSMPEGHVHDGRGLRSALEGAKPGMGLPPEFLMHYPHEHRSNYFTTCRLGPWKAIYRYPVGKQARKVELYNLEDDPFEQSDLSQKKPGETRAMLEKMKASLEAHGAQWPVDGEGREVQVEF